VQSMLQASFTSDLVLYAASGLLTYGANDGMSCVSFSCVVSSKVFPPVAVCSLELHTAAGQQQEHFSCFMTCLMSTLVETACMLSLACFCMRRACYQMVTGIMFYFMTCCAEMDNLIGSLKDAGLCKDVHYKELYIPQAELEGEQKLPVAQCPHAVHRLLYCLMQESNLLIAPAVLKMHDMPTVIPSCHNDHLFQAN